MCPDSHLAKHVVMLTSLKQLGKTTNHGVLTPPHSGPFGRQINYKQIPVYEILPRNETI